MSKKKQDQILQIDLQSVEQWNKMLLKEGLIVIDVYQDWCGPTKAMENIFRKVKMELADPLLHFATANIDKLPELEDYKGRCEPCFLYYAAKELVAVVRGANAPIIIRTLMKQLEQEHKVLNGEAKRQPIIDPLIAKIKAKKLEQMKNIMNTTKPITICIIKPDMIINNKKDEIIHKIKEKNYEILKEKEIQFTQEMANEFYKNMIDSENFNDLIHYMTSNTSCVLVLTKENTTNEDLVNDWLNDINQENPESFRAQYATDNIKNAIHGSDSHESALNELAFFFQEKETETRSEKRENSTQEFEQTEVENNEKELIKAQVDEGEHQNKKEEILVKTDDHPTPTVEEVKPNEKPSLPEEKKEIFKRFV